VANLEGKHGAEYYQTLMSAASTLHSSLPLFFIFTNRYLFVFHVHVDLTRVGSEQFSIVHMNGDYWAIVTAKRDCVTGEAEDACIPVGNTVAMTTRTRGGGREVMRGFLMIENWESGNYLGKTSAEGVVGYFPAFLKKQVVLDLKMSLKPGADGEPVGVKVEVVVIVGLLESGTP